MNRLSDAELVALALDGDKDTFVELVNRHRTTAVRLTHRLLDDEHLAADAVQEAIVIALVSLHRLRSPDRFGSWLSGQPPLDPLRAADDLAGGEPPDQLAEMSIIAEQVRDAIYGLPPGQRRATLLFYLQGLSYRETATELNITVGAVKSRLHQARRSLAPHFAPERTLQEVPPMSTTPTTDWIEVSVADVRAGGDDPTQPLHVVVLQDETGRQLPIWIGPYEATSLAISLEAEEMPRPLTYEFAAGLLDAASARVVEVRLTELVAGTYYAAVNIESPAGEQTLDARPSDALNLAAVAGAPIRVAAEILDDPKAMDRRDWRDYSNTPSQLVHQMRRRLEKTLVVDDDPPAR